MFTTLLLCLLQSSTPTNATQAPESALTPQEALAAAFPKCKIERVVHYPDKKQKAAAEKLAGKKIAIKAVRAYRASLKGKVVGTAYFDTHKIRTKGQTLLIIIDPLAKISRVEVFRFHEPPEYEPKGNWLGLYKGLPLDKKLQIKQSIPNLTGATLTARATTEAVRRVMALHAIFYPQPKPVKATTKAKPDGVEKPKSAA